MGTHQPSDVDYSCLSDPLTVLLSIPTKLRSYHPGMKYFGEHKKGTLTMAWAIARNGYASCHGGQKEYTLADGRKYVASVYGLSGSGKSTLTHAKHGGKYDIKVPFMMTLSSSRYLCFHRSGAFFISIRPPQMILQDVKITNTLLTAQNCSATLDEDGKVQLVTEDIRNGNGRAIKSKLWSPNRVDKSTLPLTLSSGL